MRLISSNLYLIRMSGYNLVTILMLVSLMLGPVYSDEEGAQAQGGGRTRKLVRRKKQPADWDLEDSRNIVYKHLTADTGAESRAIRPVKIKRRKIVNGKPQRIVRKPEKLPVQTTHPKIIPTTNNVTEPVAPKPDDAKRCMKPPQYWVI